MTWTINGNIWPDTLICAGCFNWEKIKGHCSAPKSIWGRCDLYHYYEGDKEMLDRVPKQYWRDLDAYKNASER